MKLMNEVKAELEGDRAQIHVDNGEPVEFGQLLFELEPLARGRPLDARSQTCSRRVLIANRGEVAVRVIRALHELGVEAVAVYSTADADSLHVRMADRAVCIGPPPAARELPQHPVRDRRRRRRPAARPSIPGWGFLAENPAFARGVRRQRPRLRRPARRT